MALASASLRVLPEAVCFAPRCVNAAVLCSAGVCGTTGEYAGGCIWVCVCSYQSGAVCCDASPGDGCDQGDCGGGCCLVPSGWVPSGWVPSGGVPSGGSGDCGGGCCVMGISLVDMFESIPRTSNNAGL